MRRLFIDMKIYLVKKEKNRIYKSEDIVFAISGQRLAHDEKGAPLVAEGYVSVTDTKGHWACAFSESPVGIDMEELSRKLSYSAVKKLHAKEQEYLAPLSLGSREWREEFLSIWTKKESYSKYIGKGLSMGFGSFCVLDGFEENLETGVYGAIYQNLVFGSTQPIEIEEYNYEAPMNRSALEAGADILDMFGVSAKTMEKKLISKGYSEGETKEAVEKLLDRGFLNDEEYARSLGEKYALKGYSSKRIIFELKKKGVSASDSEKEAAKHKGRDRERAEDIASKMAAKGPLDDKTKAKIARKLSSLGYDTYLVYDIIQKLN